MSVRIAAVGAREVMRTLPPVKRKKQWYVLACDGGYIGNVFELFNNSPKRPRLAVTEDLQEAIIGTETMIQYWRRQAVDVLGVQSQLVPVRFEANRKAKTTATVLDTRKDADDKDSYVYERTLAGSP